MGTKKLLKKWSEAINILANFVHILLHLFSDYNDYQSLQRLVRSGVASSFWYRTTRLLSAAIAASKSDKRSTYAHILGDFYQYTTTDKTTSFLFLLFGLIICSLYIPLVISIRRVDASESDNNKVEFYLNGSRLFLHQWPKHSSRWHLPTQSSWLS